MPEWSSALLLQLGHLKKIAIIIADQARVVANIMKGTNRLTAKKIIGKTNQNNLADKEDANQ